MFLFRLGMKIKCRYGCPIQTSKHVVLYGCNNDQQYNLLYINAVYDIYTYSFTLLCTFLYIKCIYHIQSIPWILCTSQRLPSHLIFHLSTSLPPWILFKKQDLCRSSVEQHRSNSNSQGLTQLLKPSKLGQAIAKSFPTFPSNGCHGRISYTNQTLAHVVVGFSSLWIIGHDWQE